MRILVTGIVVVGVSVGLFSEPVIAEQPRHDQKLESAAIKQVQKKMGDLTLRGAIAADEQPVFVTQDHLKPKKRSKIQYQPRLPDPAVSGDDTLPPLVDAAPRNVDAIITTSIPKDKEKYVNPSSLWEKFDSNGDPILD